MFSKETTYKVVNIFKKYHCLLQDPKISNSKSIVRVASPGREGQEEVTQTKEHKETAANWNLWILVASCP